MSNCNLTTKSELDIIELKLSAEIHRTTCFNSELSSGELYTALEISRFNYVYLLYDYSLLACLLISHIFFYIKGFHMKIVDFK